MQKSEMPKVKAPRVESWFHISNSGRYSWYRRGMPREPATNCGKKVRL